tara:strand:- start:9494 stop:9946 length:453 start_codon:yes stop_codon:yes gene_type:complete
MKTNTTTTTLLRFSIDPTQEFQALSVPQGAELIDAGADYMRNGLPAIWLLGDLEAPKQKMPIQRVLTGEPLTTAEGERKFLLRNMGISPSKSNAGQLSQKTACYFELTGLAAADALETIDAMESLNADDGAIEKNSGPGGDDATQNDPID